MAPLPVALRLGDPTLAQRIAALPGLRPVPDVGEALAVIADAPEPNEELPVLVLAEGAAALAALRAGARGVLAPEAAGPELVAALEAIRRGLSVLPPGLLAGLAGAPSEAGPLSPREAEVLALLADGASNKVIARRMGISFHTAKAHVASVLAKLGAGSRADAVARGARAGLVML